MIEDQTIEELKLQMLELSARIAVVVTDQEAIRNEIPAISDDAIPQPSTDLTHSFKVTIGTSATTGDPVVKVAKGYRCNLDEAWTLIEEHEHPLGSGGVVYMTWTHTTLDEDGNVDVPGYFNDQNDPSILTYYDVDPPSNGETMRVIRIATIDDEGVFQEKLGNIEVIDVVDCG